MRKRPGMAVVTILLGGQYYARLVSGHASNPDHRLPGDRVKSGFPVTSLYPLLAFIDAYLPTAAFVEPTYFLATGSP